MADEYIILNSKRYILWAELKEKDTKFFETTVGLSGKTLSQDFAFTDQHWTLPIFVPRNADSPNGTLTDLITAYALDYVAFTDRYSVAQGNVFFVSPFPIPWSGMKDIVPEKFKVELLVQLRQV